MSSMLKDNVTVYISNVEYHIVEIRLIRIHKCTRDIINCYLHKTKCLLYGKYANSYMSMNIHVLYHFLTQC